MIENNILTQVCLGYKKSVSPIELFSVENVKFLVLSRMTEAEVFYQKCVLKWERKREAVAKRVVWVIMGQSVILSVFGKNSREEACAWVW